jgi:hypothetical protein
VSLAAFRAEWIKLQRPKLLAPLVGSLVVLVVALTWLLFANATPQAAPPSPGAPPGGWPTFADVEGTDGALVAWTHAGIVPQLVLGIAAMVLFATQVGAEYAHGTLATALLREPRRRAFLVGKLGALAALLAVALLVALAAGLVFAFALATAQGFSTDAWWGVAPDLAALALRVLASGVGWGLFGAMLAVAFRSAAVALGVGLGYALVGEQVAWLAWSDVARDLPASTLVDLARTGGSLALAVVYGAACLALAVALVERRDVTAAA